jgi:hypothetical protein
LVSIGPLATAQQVCLNQGTLPVGHGDFRLGSCVTSMKEGSAARAEFFSSAALLTMKFAPG